jgi:hypothetical protein
MITDAWIRNAVTQRFTEHPPKKFCFEECGSTGINGIGIRIFEGVGDVHPQHLQKLDNFPSTTEAPKMQKQIFCIRKTLFSLCLLRQSLRKYARFGICACSVCDF